MADQQDKITDIDIGWLCGIIDGEGSIYIAVRQPTKKCPGGHPTPAISIFNTDVPTLERCVRILQMLEVGHWVQWPRSAQPGGRKNPPVLDGRVITQRKPAWRLHVMGLKRAGKLLPLILPYLTTKRRQGEATWDYIRHRQSRPWKSQIDEVEARCIMGASVRSSETTRRVQRMFPEAVKV